jgi:hypothetical protein
MIRVEAVAWAAAVRLLLAVLPVERVVRILDRCPQRLATGCVEPPTEPQVALAGACLGRTLARSQYLRTRRQPHAVVIGIRGSIVDFAAHAWLEPFDRPPDDFIELRRITR